MSLSKSKCWYSRHCLHFFKTSCFIRASVLGRPFQPCLIFASKAGASSRGATFTSRASSCWPRPHKLCLAWKGFPGTNALAYWTLVTKTKKFYNVECRLRKCNYSKLFRLKAASWSQSSNTFLLHP